MSAPAPLATLGWSDAFADHLTPDDAALTPARVAEVRRDHVVALTDPQAPAAAYALPRDLPAGDVAVGDWVLTDGVRVLRLVPRQSLLVRRASGHEIRQQAIAANLDTLFVVTSCNADFSLPRLERSLALAYEAGIAPVVVLTKADLAEAAPFVEQATRAARDLPVVALNAKAPDAAAQLEGWCGPGQTVALIGMSGTGKSTLTNALCGTAQATGAVREEDARGRHTTTARSLHRCRAGGWLVDTPGMREMGIMDSADGIDTVFSDVTDLAALCRFRDCAHEGEPGCAVQAAIAAGTLDPARLERWRKLRAEDAQAVLAVESGQRRGRGFGRRDSPANAAKRRKRKG